jgi:hypothetical protein
MMADLREIMMAVQTWSVDIGEDGGVLKYILSDPPAYEINGAPVTWGAAYLWIRNWHDLRDALPVAAGSYDRCDCAPCVWVREVGG